MTIRILSVLCMTALILSVFLGGCDGDSLLQSSRYRELKAFAQTIENGASLTKFEVTQKIGVPDYADGGGDHMEATSWNWRYEVFDFSGSPYRLLVHFNEHGLTVAAEFEPAPGG